MHTEMRWEGKRSFSPGLTLWGEAIAVLLDEARHDGVPDDAEVLHVSTTRGYAPDPKDARLNLTLSIKWKPGG